MNIKSILIFIVLILIGITGYFLKQYNTQKSKSDLHSPISPTVEKTTDIISEKEQILKDIEEDILCDSATTKNSCRVDKIVKNFSKGIMPQGYWIAKKDAEWQVVVRGNGIPTCEEVDNFSVPKEIYGNCIEKSGDLRNSM